MRGRPYRGARALARRLGLVAAARASRRALVTRRDPALVWEQGRAGELAFWERVLPERVAPGGMYVARDADPRMDGAAPITDPLMASVIDRVSGTEVSIIDVGAGPLTSVKKTHPGKQLEITATDPLADDYNRILDSLGVEPPIRTLAVRGEDLLDRFEPETFDIAFGRNSIDHAVDPAAVIRTMLDLVKPGGFVVLWHLPAEGERHRYHGLHQWNFVVRDGALLIQRPRLPTVRVGASFESVEDADCFERDGWLGCVLTRESRP